MNRYVLAAGAAAVVFGGTLAFAADITVTSDDLGAGSDSVATCTASADVDYNLAIANAEGYKVPSVVVNTVGTCTGHEVHVSLKGDAGAIIAQGEAAVTGTATTVTMDSSELAADIESVDVAVYSTSSGPTP